MINYPWLFCPSDNLEHRSALPTRSRASVRALLYLYWLCDPRRCEINRKVRASRRVSTLGAPHIVTRIKQTWIKHQCTVLEYMSSTFLLGISIWPHFITVHIAGGMVIFVNYFLLHFTNPQWWLSAYKATVWWCCGAVGTEFDGDTNYQTKPIQPVKADIIVVKMLKPVLCCSHDGVLLKLKKENDQHYSLIMTGFFNHLMT